MFWSCTSILFNNPFSCPGLMRKRRKNRAPPATPRQIPPRQTRPDARLNEPLWESFEGIQFKNLGAASLQCLVFLKFRFEVLQLVFQPGLWSLQQFGVTFFR